MVRRWLGIAALVGMGCTADPPPPRDPTSCEQRLAAWDDMHRGPLVGSSVVLDPRLVRDASGQASASAADGDLTTISTLAVPAEIVLRLDRPVHVTGLRYASALAGPALTDFEVSLGIGGDCWGEPVAAFAFNGTDAVQEATFDGRTASHVRVRLLGSSSGDGAVTVADFGIVVDAGITSTPPLFAAPGVEWAYTPRVSLPSAEPPALELRTAPSGMTVTGGELRWTPTPEQAGTSEVVLAATTGSGELVQRFTIAVARARVVATSSVPRSTGGSVVVMGSGTAADGLEVLIPPTEGAGDASVEVTLLEGDLPPGPEEAEAVGPAVAIRADVPDGTEIELRMPSGRIAGLDSGADPEGVSFAAFGVDALDDAGESGGWLPVLTRKVGETFSAVVRWGRRTYYRVVYAWNVVVARQDEFTVKVFLALGESREGKEELAALVASHLVADRDRILALGCTFREEQLVTIRKLLSHDGTPSTANGRVLGNAGEMELSRAGFLDMPYPNDEFRDTIAHELTHVFQFLNSGDDPFADDERWWQEATAAYNADELVDLNQWIAKYSPFADSVTRLGLVDTSDSFHAYELVVFFKALKARGGFNACDLMHARRDTGTGIAGLASLLGGSDALLDAYTTFVSGYDYVRTETVLEDSTRLFPAGSSEFAPPSSYLGWRDYHWYGTTSAAPGGHSARFTGGTPQRVSVEVKEPATGYLARVYDAAHAELGELRPGAARLDIPAPISDFYVTIAFSQDSATPFSSSRFDVAITSEYDCLDATDCSACTNLEGCGWCGAKAECNIGLISESCGPSLVTDAAMCGACGANGSCESCTNAEGCTWCNESAACVESAEAACAEPIEDAATCASVPMCALRGRSCSGSGPAFDAECCAGLICVVGACQEPGARERDACSDSDRCAVGLRCAPVSSASAGPTCCARGEDYCVSKDDCCGLMTCESGRCRARTAGESCLIGDCDGVLYCSAGTCR